MKKRPKAKEILLTILLIILGIFWSARVMADCRTNCKDCTTDTACDLSPAYCEWCQMWNESSPSCHDALEIRWPTSPAGTDLTSCSTLPGMIKYFYEWGIAIGGLMTFFALIMAGFQYLTSVGRPEAMREAMSRIQSAVLGLFLLFGSWLILNTINPELTTFQPLSFDISKIPPTTEGLGKPEGLPACEYALVYPGPDWSGIPVQVDLDSRVEPGWEPESIQAFYRKPDNERHCADGVIKCYCPGVACDCDDVKCPDPSCDTPCECSVLDESCACGTQVCGCGEIACGCVAQLFTDGCDDKIGDVNAFSNNLTKWTDREIQCVGLVH